MKENKKLTFFNLPSTKNKIFKSKNLKDRFLVLYFYPKDLTSGCTLQAKDFSKNYKLFKKKNWKKIGISADNLDSHKKFKKKIKIPFELLSDTKKKIIMKFKAWGKKSMYGKSFFGIRRTTYLIDPNKKIIKVWKNVKVKNHVKEVLKTLIISKKSLSL